MCLNAWCLPFYVFISDSDSVFVAIYACVATGRHDRTDAGGGKGADMELINGVRE